MLKRTLIISFVLIFITGCSLTTSLEKSAEANKSKTAKTALIQKISLAVPKGKVESSQVVFSPDSTMVAAIVSVNRKKSQVMIWNTQNGKLLHSTELTNITSVWSDPMQFTPDNKKLFYSGQGTGQSFIWHFTENTKPISCVTGQHVISLTSEHVLVDPADYVVGLFSLKSCKAITLGVDDRARKGGTILTPDNKMLWVTSKKHSKSFIDEWLYNKDPKPKMYHSKRFKGKTDILVLPTMLPKKEKVARDYSEEYIFNPNRTELLHLDVNAKTRTTALSLWDIKKKKVIWKNKYKTGKLFTFSSKYHSAPDGIYHFTKFNLNRFYILDKQSIKIIDLITGKTIKSLTYPRDSLIHKFGGYYSDRPKFFISEDATKLFINTDYETEVFSLQTGKTIKKLITPKLIRLVLKVAADKLKNKTYDPCPKSQWKCLFNVRDGTSQNGNYIAYGRSEHSGIVVNIVTDEVVIKNIGHTISKFSTNAKGNTVIVTSKNDHELVLWKLR